MVGIHGRRSWEASSHCSSSTSSQSDSSKLRYATFRVSRFQDVPRIMVEGLGIYNKQRGGGANLAAWAWLVLTSASLQAISYRRSLKDFFIDRF